MKYHKLKYLNKNILLPPFKGWFGSSQLITWTQNRNSWRKVNWYIIFVTFFILSTTLLFTYYFDNKTNWTKNFFKDSFVNLDWHLGFLQFQTFWKLWFFNLEWYLSFPQFQTLWKWWGKGDFWLKWLFICCKEK